MKDCKKLVCLIDEHFHNPEILMQAANYLHAHSKEGSSQ